MKKKIEPEIVVHESSPAGLPVEVGCPFPSEQVPDGPFAAVLSMAGGEEAQAQCVALTPPTPAGLRWAELSFQATSAGKARVRILPQGKAAPAAIARETRAGVELCNGRVRVTLCAHGDKPPFSVETAEGGRWRALGSMAPESAIGKGKVHREAPKGARRIRILRNGPVRAQVELTGQLADSSGRPSLSYRLTVEVWKGTAAVRIGWMLMHLAPGVPPLDVRRATLAGTWRVGGKPVRRFLQSSHGLRYRPRAVTNPAPVTLATDFTCGPVHVSDPAMLLDDVDYPPYLTAPLVSTAEWLCLAGGDAAVFATLADFTATRPNQLASAGSRLDYHLIPPGHPTLWPQGRRKEQTLFLSFAPGASSEKEDSAALAALSALRTEGRAQPDPGFLRAMSVFDTDLLLANARGRNVRLTALLDLACSLDTPGDKWNLGDTPDIHYTRTYVSTPNHFHPLPGGPQTPPQFAALGHMALWPSARVHFVEPVWTNNEYDIIHALSAEVMRTGKSDHARMLRWTARHNVEVDFVAYSDDPNHHRATPFHSHHHNMKATIPSHFFAQGLLEYYCLTGDRDALDAAQALGDKILGLFDSPDEFKWAFDRELGWSLLTLACLVEAGFERYRAACDRAAQFLMDFDRAAFSGAVWLSSGVAGRSLERQMIDGSFGYASMIEGMDRYQKFSGRKDAARWLERLLRQLKDEAWNAISEAEGLYLSLGTQMMAIGYERTGDPSFLHVGLVGLEGFLLNGINGDYWGQVKPCAAFHRSLCRFLGHADRLNLLDRYELPTILQVRKKKR